MQVTVDEAHSGMVGDSDRRIAVADAEVARLKDELSKTRESLMAAEADCADVKRSLAFQQSEAHHEVSVAELKRSVANKEVRDVKRKSEAKFFRAVAKINKEAKTTSASLKDQVKMLQAQLGDVSAREAILAEDLPRISELLHKTENDFASKSHLVDNLSAEINTVQLNLASANETVNRLTIEVASGQELADILESDLAKVRDSESSLLAERVSLLEAQTALETRVGALGDEVASGQVLVDGLESDLAKVRDSESSLLAERVSLLEAQTALEVHNAALVVDVPKMAALLEDTTAKLDEKSDLVDVLTSKLEGVMIDLGSSNETVERLGDEVASGLVLVDGLESDLGSALKNELAAKQELAVVTQRIADEKEMTLDFITEIEGTAEQDMHMAALAARSELHLLTTRLSALQLENERIQSDSSAAEERHEQASVAHQERLVTVQAQCDAFELRVDELKAALKTSGEEKDAIVLQEHDMRDAHDALQRLLADVQESLAQSTAEKTALLAELERVQLALEREVANSQGQSETILEAMKSDLNSRAARQTLEDRMGQVETSFAQERIQFDKAMSDQCAKAEAAVLECQRLGGVQLRLEGEVALLNTKCNNLEVERKRLADETERHAVLADTVAVLECSARETTEQHTAALAEVTAALETERQRHTTALADVDAKYKTTLAEFSANAVSEREDHKADLARVDDKHTRAVAELTAEYAAEQDRLSTALTSANVQHATELQSTVDKFMSDMAVAQSAAEAQRANLTSEHVSESRAMSDVHAREMEALKEQLAAALAAVAPVQAEVARVMGELEANERARIHLEGELASANTLYAEATAEKVKLETEQANASALSSQKFMEQVTRAHDSAAEERRGLRDEVTKLNADITALEEERTVLMTERNTLTSALKALRESTSTEITELKGLLIVSQRETASEKASALNELQQQKRDLEQQLHDELARHRDTARVEREASHNESYKRQQDLLSEVARCHSIRCELESKLVSTEAMTARERNALETELAKLRGQTDADKVHMDAKLSAVENAADAEIARLSNSVRDLEKHADDEHTRLLTQVQELTEAKNEADALFEKTDLALRQCTWDLDASMVKCEALSDERTRLQAARDVLMEECKENERLMSAKETATEQMQQMATRLNRAEVALTRDRKKALAALEEAQKQLVNERAEAVAALARVEARAEAADSELSVLRREFYDCTEELEGSKRATAEADAALNKAGRDVMELKQREARIVQQCQTLAVRTDELITEAAARAARIKELDDCLAKAREDKAADLIALQNAQEKVKSHFNAAQKSEAVALEAEEERDDALRRVEEAEGLLTQAQRAVQTAEDARVEATWRAERVQQLCVDVSDKLQSTEGQLAHAMKDQLSLFDSLKSSYASLDRKEQDRYESLSKAEAAFKAIISRMLNEHRSLEQRLAEMEKQQGRADAEVAVANRRAELAETAAETVRHQLVAATEQARLAMLQLEQRRGDEESNLVDARSALVEEQRKVMVACQEVRDVTLARDGLTIKLGALESELAVMKRGAQQLEAELAIVTDKAKTERESALDFIQEVEKVAHQDKEAGIEALRQEYCMVVSDKDDEISVLQKSLEVAALEKAKAECAAADAVGSAERRAVRAQEAVVELEGVRAKLVDGTRTEEISAQAVIAAQAALTEKQEECAALKISASAQTSAFQAEREILVARVALLEAVVSESQVSLDAAVLAHAQVCSSHEAAAESRMVLVRQEEAVARGEVEQQLALARELSIKTDALLAAERLETRRLTTEQSQMSANHAVAVEQVSELKKRVSVLSTEKDTTSIALKMSHDEVLKLSRRIDLITTDLLSSKDAQSDMADQRRRLLELQQALEQERDELLLAQDALEIRNDDLLREVTCGQELVDGLELDAATTREQLSQLKEELAATELRFSEEREELELELTAARELASEERRNALDFVQHVEAEMKSKWAIRREESEAKFATSLAEKDATAHAAEVLTRDTERKLQLMTDECLQERAARTEAATKARSQFDTLAKQLKAKVNELELVRGEASTAAASAIADTEALRCALGDSDKKLSQARREQQRMEQALAEKTAELSDAKEAEANNRSRMEVALAELKHTTEEYLCEKQLRNDAEAEAAAARVELETCSVLERSSAQGIIDAAKARLVAEAAVVQEGYNTILAAKEEDTLALYGRIEEMSNSLRLVAAKMEKDAASHLQLKQVYEERGADVARLEHDLASSQGCVVETNKVCKLLRSQIENLLLAASLNARRIRQVEGQNKALEDQLGSLRQELESASSMGEQLSDLTDQLTAMAGEKNVLAEQFAEFRAATHERENVVLANELSAKNELRKVLIAGVSEREDLQNKVASLTSSLATTEAQTVEAASKAKAAATEREHTLESLVHNASMELQQYREQAVAREESLCSELLTAAENLEHSEIAQKQLTEALTASQAQCEELTRKHSESQCAVAALTLQEEALRSRMAGLTIECETGETELKKLVVQVEAARASKAAHEEELALAERESKQLREELELLRAQHGSLYDNELVLVEMLEMSRQENKGALNRVAQLERQLSELETTKKRFATLSQERADMEMRADSAGELAGELQATLVALEKSTRDAEAEHEMSIAALRVQMEEAKDDRDTLARQKAQNEEELQSALMASTEESRRRHEQQKKRFGDDISQRDAAISKLEQVVESVAVDQDHMQNARDALLRAKSDLKQSMAERTRVQNEATAMKLEMSREKEDLLAALAVERERNAQMVRRIEAWGKVFLERPSPQQAPSSHPRTIIRGESEP
jgi:chromosome segregation ATPase